MVLLIIIIIIILSVNTYFEKQNYPNNIPIMFVSLVLNQDGVYIRIITASYNNEMFICQSSYRP